MMMSPYLIEWKDELPPFVRLQPEGQPSGVGASGSTQRSGNVGVADNGEQRRTDVRNQAGDGAPQSRKRFRSKSPDREPHTPSAKRTAGSQAWYPSTPITPSSSQTLGTSSSQSRRDRLRMEIEASQARSSQNRGAEVCSSSGACFDGPTLTLSSSVCTYLLALTGCRWSSSSIISDDPRGRR